MLKPFLTDYDHQGPLPGVDRFLYDAGNLENRIPWISLYLAGNVRRANMSNFDHIWSGSIVFQSKTHSSSIQVGWDLDTIRLLGACNLSKKV